MTWSSAAHILTASPYHGVRLTEREIIILRCLLRVFENPVPHPNLSLSIISANYPQPRHRLLITSRAPLRNRHYYPDHKTHGYIDSLLSASRVSLHSETLLKVEDA